jgi:hypothetical protein
MALLLASRPGLLLPGWEKTMHALRKDLPLEEPSPPEGERGYRGRMEERGRRKRLSARINRLLKELYRYRALTREEEEARAELRGRAEVLLEELDREGTPLEALEKDGEALSRDMEDLLGRVRHRLEEGRARLLEEAKALKAQAQEAYNLAQRLRSLALRDPEAGMEELEKRGMVRRVAPEALPAPEKDQGEAIIRALSGVVGAALALGGRPEGWGMVARAAFPQVFEPQRRPPSSWEFRGQRVSNPQSFLTGMAQSLEKWAQDLSRRAEALRMQARGTG